MDLRIGCSKRTISRHAAGEAAAVLRAALAAGGEARLVLATGASQFDFLGALVEEPGLAWDRVTLFHLDEYAGMSEEHPASFRRYLRERFVSQVPSLGRFVSVEGDAADLRQECERLGREISAKPVDLACIGIGENGHIAFNDPPADFLTEDPYIVVELDDACRNQQLGEGWFASLADVPTRAISMSVRHILRSARIVCTVPDARKAEAVRASLEGPVTNLVPASALREHGHCTLYLDDDSAALLGEATRRTATRLSEGP